MKAIFRAILFQAIFLSQNITADTSLQPHKEKLPVEFSYTGKLGDHLDMSVIESDQKRFNSYEMTEGL